MEGHVPGGNDPSAAYAAFRADFQRAWMGAFDWPPSIEALQAEIASSRVAETLENL